MCYVYGMCINCVCVWILIESSLIEIFFFFRDHDIITFLPYTIYMYGMCLLFVTIIREFWKQKLNSYITYSFLGHLSHSGDLLLWVGVRRRASSVVR